MRKNLILITNQFPFGRGESFLENEFPFLYEAFEQITIIARTNEKDITRKIPSKVKVVNLPPKSGVKSVIQSIASLIIKIHTYFRILNEEIDFIKEILPSRNTFSLWAIALHDVIKAIEIKTVIEKHITDTKDNETVLYSYWQNNAALALALIKAKRPELKTISRAHGADLYFHRKKEQYISYRKFISQQIDHLCFISENGIKYQQKLLNEKNNNFSISRLGTLKIEDKTKQTNNKIRIVSCSNIIALKRIHLIIEILTLIKNIKIEWVHFGSGKLENEIHNLAQEKLEEKITYEFKGYISNKNVHKYYAENNVDLFINVSETEGIPVSIMEAMSYGIPAIATDVGGTSEIVNSNCGILLEKHFNPKLVAEQVVTLATNTKLRRALSKEAHEQWKKKYSAKRNYTDFLYKTVLFPF